MKIMRVSARPSKAFLFSKLEKDLKGIKGVVGVDAAPANFKNYPLFKTEKYVGIDLSIDLLREGKSNYPQGIAICDNLSTALLPHNSVDVVVSTNTLQQIGSGGREKAIENFCQWVNPTGTLLMEMDQENLTIEIKDLIESNFGSVSILYYRNSLSRWFESFLEKDGRVIIDDYPSFLKRIIYIISKFISVSEYITANNKKNKKHVYVKCMNKMSKKVNDFSVSNHYKNEDGFYRLK